MYFVRRTSTSREPVTRKSVHEFLSLSSVLPFNSLLGERGRTRPEGHTSPFIWRLGPPIVSRTVDRIETSAREHRSSVSLVDCPWATGTEVLSPREPRSWRVGNGDQSLPCTLRFRLTVRGIEHLRELPERTGPTYPEANSEKYNVPVNRKMFVVSCHRSGALPIVEHSGNDDQDEEEGRTLEEGLGPLSKVFIALLFSSGFSTASFLFGFDLFFQTLYFTDWSVIDLGHVAECSGGLSGLAGTLVTGI